MFVMGCDYSTRFVDFVRLDLDSDRAEWDRYELVGADAFDRARSVGLVVPGRAMSYWDDCIAVGIEDPRGYNAGSLYRVQGAVLACVPASTLVQPWIPSAWRRAVGLKGNATKADVYDMVDGERLMAEGTWLVDPWPQDACDAYCIALATRSRLQRKEAA